MRIWLLLAGVVAVAAGLIAVLVIDGGSSESSSERPPGVPSDQKIAERVADIRELAFEERPPVRVLSEEEAIEEQERQERELQSDPSKRRAVERARRQQRAALELLKLVGILEPDEDIDKLLQQGGGQLAGLYDYEERNIRLIEEAVEDNPEQTEVTLAHEFTHALDHQHFGAKLDRLAAASERSLGYLSLQEGLATLVETQYGIRHMGLEPPRREYFERQHYDTGRQLPPALEDAAAFPYRRGAQFADALYRRANGWRLLNRAQRRPPISSEQVLHPGKWLRNEQPRSVELDLSDTLGDGWERLGSDVVGEFDTAAIMRLAGSRMQGNEAGAGWGGGRFDLWRRKDADCQSPCREHTVLAIAWEWDTAADAQQQVALVPRYVENALNGQRTGAGLWRLPDQNAWVAFVRSGTRTGLVFAPDRRLAREAGMVAAG